MSTTAPKVPFAVAAIAMAAALLAAVALQQAAEWYQHPFPGILLTPEGNVSSIGMPTWDGIEQGLRFPDRIVSVDGAPLKSSGGEYAARAWDRAIAKADRERHPSVHVEVLTATGSRQLDLRLGALDEASWWLYGGTVIFVGALYALAGIVALSSSPRGVLARAFLKFALLTSIYFLTFFDAHTTRSMVPLFDASQAWAPFALVALTLRIPDDVALVRRLPWLPRALDVPAVLLAAVWTARNAVGAPVTGIRSACTLLLGGALIMFVVVLGVRYAHANGTRRDILRVLFRATATPYVLVGFGVLVAQLSSRGSVAAFFAIPAMGLAPVATGVAFMRHDLWGSRALLSRVLTRAVAGAVACVFAVGVGAALSASLGIPFRSALGATAVGALVSAPLLYLAMRVVERSFFPALSEYKPTIEQLSEELTSIKDPSEVAQAIERTVRRWLPCQTVEFLATEGDGVPSVHDDAPSESDDERSILAEFGGRILGSLRVGHKRGGALFTSDDIDLLRTIANQAALALAHAHSYAELERRRQQQVAAWQVERAALVETVAAEIAHEVRYPINFFRSVFQRDAQDAKLESEEIEIGREEVDRLERLVSGLRRMVGQRLERQLVPVADLVVRVEVLLRDALSGRELASDVPPSVALRCDPDQVTQVMVNLVSNALDATGIAGHVGLLWTSDAEGAELVVWDDGPGFDGDPARLFAPWFTTKTRGTGLGLAITQRIVRAHGWRIDAVRVCGRTQFTVSVPASDVLETAARASSETAHEGAREIGEIH